MVSIRVTALALVAAALILPFAQAGLVDVEPTSNADGGIAVSGLSDAHSDCVDLGFDCAPGAAVAGTGNANSGGVALAGSGSANAGFASVSGENAANSEGISVAGGSGAATGDLVAVALLGNATCRTSGCVAVSATNNAQGGSGSADVSGCVVFSAADHADFCGFGFGEGAYNDFWCVVDKAPLAQSCVL